MKVERSTLYTVLCTLVLLGILTAFFPLAVLPQRFESWDWSYPDSPLPVSSQVFRRAYGAGLSIPVLFTVAAGYFFRNGDGSQSRLVSFTCCCLLIMALWCAWTLAVALSAQ
jgi:hypothetical protein